MSMIHSDNWRRGGVEAWDSLYISLVSLPSTLMLAVLASDALYWASASALWSQASRWLLGAGLATGVIAAADGLVRYISAGGIRPSKACWMHVAGNVLALLLSLSNLVYRLNENGVRAVIPTGISLTAIVVCLLFMTAHLGHETAIDARDGELDDVELF
jgi:uncharacterized membrane protein